MVSVDKNCINFSNIPFPKKIHISDVIGRHEGEIIPHLVRVDPIETPTIDTFVDQIKRLFDITNDNVVCTSWVENELCLLPGSETVKILLILSYVKIVRLEDFKDHVSSVSYNREEENVINVGTAHHSDAVAEHRFSPKQSSKDECSKKNLASVEDISKKHRKHNPPKVKSFTIGGLLTELRNSAPKETSVAETDEVTDTSDPPHKRKRIRKHKRQKVEPTPLFESTPLERTLISPKPFSFQKMGNRASHVRFSDNDSEGAPDEASNALEVDRTVLQVNGSSVAPQALQFTEESAAAEKEANFESLAPNLNSLETLCSLRAIHGAAPVFAINPST